MLSFFSFKINAYLNCIKTVQCYARIYFVDQKFDSVVDQRRSITTDNLQSKQYEIKAVFDCMWLLL